MVIVHASAMCGKVIARALSVNVCYSDGVPVITKPLMLWWSPSCGDVVVKGGVCDSRRDSVP